MKVTANIELPAGKTDHIVFDDRLIGFGLRLRLGSGGIVRRNWIIQYRHHGRGRRMIVGDAEKLSAAQARERAKKLLAEVELGEDPAADRIERRERDEHTLRSVARQFIDAKAELKPASLALLRLYLLGPHLGPLHKVPIDKIVRKDIAARLLLASKERGAPTAIALRSAVSSCFTWAMQMGLVDANPVIASFRPEKPRSRERVLSDQELAAIWRGVGDETDYSRCIRLLVLCGARRQEVGGARWSEIDFDKGTWTIPAQRSKNAKPHTLPLTPLMLSIIESVPRRDGLDHLFGRSKRGFTSWAASKRLLDAKLGLKPHWTTHDIRRTVATRLGDLGVQPHIVEEVLGHHSGHRRGVAGIYNRSPYEREVKAALALWSDHVRTIVEGGERKVVALRPAHAGAAS